MQEGVNFLMQPRSLTRLLPLLAAPPPSLIHTSASPSSLPASHRKRGRGKDIHAFTLKSLRFKGTGDLRPLV